ncbi:tetratricopeptide repeat protein [Haloechinothrix sp. LS1_15]|uniref:tetratricopeptide repeat protein n=1 Tax=Haloechinothrix sp. LS1_15 TaxID=2652248 RepID=UPI0029478D45|nr:tetratricopeptide repeat protein [Haloechinothrix sp. LS1_15]MDV6011852.1 tetratricopeptide repeat protein [Haloechinothrix sp. LS1_15]
MSTGDEPLRERRDQALRDLVDLEAQIERGEIPAERAAELRRRYEAEAVASLDALESASASPAEAASRSGGRRRIPPTRYLPYLAAALVALLAGAVLLPQYVDSRPEGGFITGNEPIADQLEQQADDAPREPSEFSLAEMEEVVAANPEAIGMRIALASRYIDRDEHDSAAEHLGAVMQRDPDNPRAHAYAGWLLFQQDEPDAALRAVERGLEADPESPEALWFAARIRLDGHDDPSGALDALDTLTAQDGIDPELRADAEKLVERAQQRTGGDGR